MAERISNVPSLEDEEEEEHDISTDIALAVASILAESDVYNQRPNSEVAITYDNLAVTVTEDARNKSSTGGGEKKVVKPVSKASKVRKTDKTGTSKSKSNVKLTTTFQPDSAVWDKRGNTENQYNDVEEILESGLATMNKGTSPQPPAAVIPRNATMMDISLYLGRVQTYINQLGYQRQGEPKIKVNTQMSVKHLLDTAKSIIKAGDQIKCLHALVLAIHFTNCTPIIERFPINFKSEFEGKEYKHVVLGIYLYGYFGALGISRDNGLQDKPPSFSRLSDMIKDFHTSYTESGHELLEVKIGGIITHDPYSLEPIPWKIHLFHLKKLSEMEVGAGIERCAKLLRSKMGSYCLKNVRPTGPSSEVFTNATPKPTTIFPSKSATVNASNLLRARKTTKSKYNVDIGVKTIASSGFRLPTRK